MSDMQSESPTKQSLSNETSTNGSSVSKTPPIKTPSSESASIKTPSDDTPPTAETLAKESSNKEECGPCKEVRFAFGRTGNYFLAVQDKERFERVYCYLKSAVAESFKTLSISWPIYSVALEPDGGIHIAAVSKASDAPTPLWAHCGPASNLATAYELVYHRVWHRISDEHSSSIESLSHVNVTFGPLGAYFCTFKDGSFYRDIPFSLVSKLESVEVKPRQVALGRGKAWVALWTDGTFSYNLGAHYPDLADALNERIMTKAEIAFIALNPYDDDSWFMVDCNGFCSWSFKNMKQDQIDEIRKLTLGYIQRRSRRTGDSYTNVSTSGKKTVSTRITPETSYDEPRKSTFRSAQKFADFSIQMGYKNSIGLQRGLNRPDVVAGCAAGISTTVLCRAFGLKLGSALKIGVAASAITFTVVSKSLNG